MVVFFRDTPVSSTNKTDHHEITEVVAQTLPIRKNKQTNEQSNQTKQMKSPNS